MDIDINVMLTDAELKVLKFGLDMIEQEMGMSGNNPEFEEAAETLLRKFSNQIP